MMNSCSQQGAVLPLNGLSPRLNNPRRGVEIVNTARRRYRSMHAAPVRCRIVNRDDVAGDVIARCCVLVGR
jgi:hypothetical protein